MGERASPIWGGLALPSAGRSLVPVLPSAAPEMSQLHLLAPRPGLQGLRGGTALGKGESWRKDEQGRALRKQYPQGFLVTLIFLANSLQVAYTKIRENLTAAEKASTR